MEPDSVQVSQARREAGMRRSLITRALMAACVAYLVSGCAATPSVTSSAPGRVFKVHKSEPGRTAIDILGLELLAVQHPVKTSFWVFAEDDVDFRFDGTEVSPQSKREPYIHWVTPSSNDLTKIGDVNGLPIAVHLGHLLVGMPSFLHWRDFGPVADGDTVELTASGIVVDGRYRGALPES